MIAEEPKKTINIENASSGIETTARLCGYGSDVSRFESGLKQTIRQMGLSIESLKNLLDKLGIEMSTDTPSSL